MLRLPRHLVFDHFTRLFLPFFPFVAVVSVRNRTCILLLACSVLAVFDFHAPLPPAVTNTQTRAIMELFCCGKLERERACVCVCLCLCVCVSVSVCESERPNHSVARHPNKLNKQEKRKRKQKTKKERQEEQGWAKEERAANHSGGVQSTVQRRLVSAVVHLQELGDGLVYVATC